jgi:predicted phosphoribosyltransferase
MSFTGSGKCYPERHSHFKKYDMNPSVSWTSQPGVHNGEVLAKKLWSYRHTNTLLVASSPSSEPLAESIGEHLDLPRGIHYCKSLEDPANKHRTIGSTTATEVLLKDRQASLPQGYIQHQVMQIQHDLRKQQDEIKHNYAARTVVIVRDDIKYADDVFALIEELRKSGTSSIIIATAEISRQALVQLEKVTEYVAYLNLHNRHLSAPHQEEEKNIHFHHDQHSHHYTRERTYKSAEQRPESRSKRS